MPEYPVSASNYRDPYDHDHDHAACLHQPGAVVTPADSLVDNIAALRKLAEDILNPEVYGFSVTSDVRGAARRALGIREGEAPRNTTSRTWTDDEVAQRIVEAQEDARKELLTMLQPQVQFRVIGWLRRYPNQHTIFIDLPEKSLPSDTPVFTAHPAAPEEEKLYTQDQMDAAIARVSGK